MFDIGFWELILVAVVALLVVGPQRLPKLAYDAGMWFGRLQRFIRKTRYQIENELHQYEVRQSFEQQNKLLEEIKSELNDTVHELKQPAGSTLPSDEQSNKRT